jgi:multiple antibiotic resistance protein
VSSFLDAFFLLFTIIDPIGSVPVFIAVVARAPKHMRRRIAIRAVLIATGILMLFTAVGRPLLDGIGVQLTSFRIAGGIILFLFALDMLFGESKPEAEVHAVEAAAERHMDLAVYPMAIPSIAGPGAITAVVVLSDGAHAGDGTLGQLRIAAAAALVLLIALILLLAAERIHAVIGDAGASIVSRVMGLLTAAIAAESVLSGIQDHFGLATAAAATASAAAGGG